MLYVAAGLVAMFGALAVIGLGAIDQATQLVFQERLATAYTTAGILQRDFARVASDTNEAVREVVTSPASRPGSAAAMRVMDHFDRVAPYLFFRVSGVWLLDASGRILSSAGAPAVAISSGGSIDAGLLPPLGDTFVVRAAAGPVPGSVALSSIAVHLTTPVEAATVAIVHTVSINATTDYAPASYGTPDGAAPTVSPMATALHVEHETAAGGGYHLEVVDSNGITVLGIGNDEQPGQSSRHFTEIMPMMAKGESGAMIHASGSAAAEPHVMAVVPLAASPFYVVLEQPIDIALALPHQLRDRLLLATSLGFVAALIVAWVTTRHVVKPTEQLTRAAGRMARGDLTSPIDVRADDEVGLLAESLEVLRRQLAAAQEAAERTKAELERRVADRTSRLNLLLGQTINAQEDERRRLARELHDETAQTLAALTITLDRARDDLTASSPAALDRIGEARTTAARLLAETRRLILGLRPAVLDDLGLLPAIRWYAETGLADSDVEVSIDADEAPPRLPDFLEVALFRIVQEAISNIAKHARARRASIRFHVDVAEVTVTIIDDGVGFAIDDATGEGRPGAGRVGLIGMQERVRLINGQIMIQSSPSGGTTIVVRVPIGAEAV